MDVSFYISQLLEQRGEISVPGLGYLVLAHMPGYYNEAEGKFYPPYHQVQYDEYELDGDDALAEYMAVKKNISSASAKYFIEKYVNILKEEALVKGVPIGNLGWFYTYRGRLAFKAANRVTNDPAFLGYPPVDITGTEQSTPPFIETNKAAEPPQEQFFEPQPVIQPIQQPVEPPPIVQQPVEQPVIQQPDAQQIIQQPEEEEIYDEEPKRSYAWLIVLSVVVIAALAVFIMYEFYPDQYKSAMGLTKNNKTVTTSKTEVKKPAIATVIPAKIDSSKGDTIKTILADTIKNEPVQPYPATPTGDQTLDPTRPWVVIVLACRTQTEADAAINTLKAKGIDAFTVPMHNASINIAIGAYSTNAQADAARINFNAAGIKFATSKQIQQRPYLTHIKIKK